MSSQPLPYLPMVASSIDINTTLDLVRLVDWAIASQKVITLIAVQDYEQLPENAAAMLQIVMMRIMLKRLA